VYFKQFYLGCLAHASYLIGSDGEAAVVDPQRDVDQYIAEASAHSFKIKHVIETHFHADFVSGHREIAARTGADIVFGHQARPSFPYRAVRDGDEIRIGHVTLRIIETPGHTPESISVLVIDNEVASEPLRVLTGDALFIGDVGRPDLVASRGYTARQMAGLLYDSLHEKLLKLDDTVQVYPAHGAGSMCGRNIGSGTFTTIGQERWSNYALKPMPKEDFVQMMTVDLPEAPSYFARDAEINRGGAAALDEIRRPEPLGAEQVKAFTEQKYLVLDVRSAAAFGNGHLPHAMNIGLGGQFASWAGTLIQNGTPIIIVSDDVTEVYEAVTRLSRVGIESVKGYLEGGMLAWNKAGFDVASIAQVTTVELEDMIDRKSELQIIDVRRPGEYNSGHLERAVNAPLNHLTEMLQTFDRERATVVICASGYRSGIAVSLLHARGFDNLFNVVGGMSAWPKPVV
jgi:glyoxylase-like metal-dependent hydrolase (beta-lactamase superfamily II)/rhodanese-related sulfurtransferase